MISTAPGVSGMVRSSPFLVSAKCANRASKSTSCHRRLSKFAPSHTGLDRELYQGNEPSGLLASPGGREALQLAGLDTTLTGFRGAREANVTHRIDG